MRCGSCGASVDRNDLFCPECGLKLENTRKVTVWTLVKSFFLLAFFYVIWNLFRYQPKAAVILIAFFLIWFGFLDWFLMFLLRTELSAGVKVIMTFFLVVGFVYMAQPVMNESHLTKAVQAQANDPRIIMLMDNINTALMSKDVEAINSVYYSGLLSDEVLESLTKAVSQKELGFYLVPKYQRFYGGMAEVGAIVSIEQAGQKKEGMVLLYFEKTNIGWKLSSMNPGLLDIKIGDSSVNIQSR